MPDMDGFAVAERIKRTPRVGSLAIMMLTSGGKRGDAARCRKLDIAAYLTKPISQSELLDAIVTTLGGQAALDGEPRLVTRHSLREKRPRRHILLAEDNEVNQQVATGILEKSGHRVTSARTGREALALLDGGGIDLVLMDVQMPEMGGLEATAAIREKEKATGTRVPIIAMTAHAMKGDREQCLESGMDDYVSKPINARDLLAAIERRFGDGTSLTSPHPAEPSDKTFDRKEALSRVDGDAELLEQTVRLFLAECPALLGEIRAAVEHRDAVRLQRAAHSLGGAAATLSAGRVTGAALTMEMIGRDMCLDRAPGALTVLEKEIARLMRAMTMFCKTAAA